MPRAKRRRGKNEWHAQAERPRPSWLPAAVVGGKDTLKRSGLKAELALAQPPRIAHSVARAEPPRPRDREECYSRILKASALYPLTMGGNVAIFFASSFAAASASMAILARWTSASSATREVGPGVAGRAPGADARAASSSLMRCSVAAKSERAFASWAACWGGVVDVGAPF